MIYIEAPSDLVHSGRGFRRLFLAGGITGCPNWQREMVAALEKKEDSLIVLNPRRENFPIHDSRAAYAQIEWEHQALRFANLISFWFPKETLCPIVLYELGAWSMSDTFIYVGVHPEYPRRQDVEIQTKLVRPDVTIASSLDELIDQVRKDL